MHLEAKRGGRGTWRAAACGRLAAVRGRVRGVWAGEWDAVPCLVGRPKSKFKPGVAVFFYDFFGFSDYLFFFGDYKAVL